VVQKSPSGKTLRQQTGRPCAKIVVIATGQTGMSKLDQVYGHGKLHRWRGLVS
jgi:hypothetical protein